MWNDKKGYNNKYRGISSLGRAVGSQSAGRGIETPIFHIFLSNPKETKKNYGGTGIRARVKRITTAYANHYTIPPDHDFMLVLFLF